METLTISLNNFRAFAETGSIEIKPITILVGENSTGKTSFLAALRFAFGMSDRSKPGYFNIYPFDLGSYDDVVHNAGPSTSKHRFSVTINKMVDIASEGSIVINGSDKADMRSCTLQTFFESRFGEVAISSLMFEVDNLRMDYSGRGKGRLSVARDESKIDLSTEEQLTMFSDAAEVSIDDLRRVSYRLFDAVYGPKARSRKIDKQGQEALLLISRAFDAFISQPYTLHSSPPVRSIPRRVYTSSDDIRSDEQSHAPHELSRLKRANKSRWTRLNSGLTRFGRLSGLFTRFNITKLTRQDAGPFQLKITVRGRSSNIADVGYGVSQALPIMTDLIESGQERTVFLFQQPEIHLHPKAQASLGTIFAEYVAGHPRSFLVAETHSDYLIDRIRIEVRRKTVLPEMVSILYFESLDNSVRIHMLSIDGSGNVVGAPEQYRDFFIREQEEILGL